MSVSDSDFHADVPSWPSPYPIVFVPPLSTRPLFQFPTGVNSGTLFPGVGPWRIMFSFVCFIIPEHVCHSRNRAFPLDLHGSAKVSPFPTFLTSAELAPKVALMASIS